MEKQKYEPKKSNRFKVTLPKEFDIPEWVICEADRPSVRIEESENENTTSSLNLKTTKWDTITIKFVDPIIPSTTKRLWSLLIASTDDILDGDDQDTAINKLKELVNNFDFNLSLLDNAGDEIEKWMIKNCSIVSFDFGRLDYSYDNIVNCSITIQPKKVSLEF